MTLSAHSLAVAFSAVFLFACPGYTATSCSHTVSQSVPAPTTAPGVESRLVATNLTYPRGIIFDNAGRLLVVDRGVGVKALTLEDDGGPCVYAKKRKLVIKNIALNHGIEFSEDGLTLFASTVAEVLAYTYDPATATVTGKGQTIIKGMYNTDHSTRTILRSRFQPDTLIINRGSQSNIDPLAANESSGHAQVKAFSLANLPSGGYDFTNDGTVLGWGMRNNVGLSEHPVTGGIWTVENSVDNISRDGEDFHQRNPGEKLNYLGTLINNTSPNQGSNFGYPECFAAWVPKAVPEHGDLKVGEQFSINSDITDAQCQARTAPRLVFDAHTAPLDIKFHEPAGLQAFVSFHGSHDRTVPHGYDVAKILFNEDYQPIAPSTSKKSLINLVGVKDKLGCPDTNKCIRPVGLAFDQQDRLYFSSDYTGEIYVATNVISAK